MIKQIVKEIWMNSKIKYIDIFVYYSFYFKYERKSRKKKITYKKKRPVKASQTVDKLGAGIIPAPSLSTV